MTDPLVVEFAVAAPVEHAFLVWTDRCALWWPPSHTLSGNPAAIVFEPRSGGRIFERAPDGVEHSWGEVLNWEPPRRLRYRWHLFFDPSEATEVEITFTGGPTVTVVRIEQSGWERLGASGPSRRTRTGHAWAAISTVYAKACEAG